MGYGYFKDRGKECSNPPSTNVEFVASWMDGPEVIAEVRLEGRLAVAVREEASLYFTRQQGEYIAPQSIVLRYAFDPERSDAIDYLLEKVCDHFGVEPTKTKRGDLKGKKVSRARRLSIYLCCELLHETLPITLIAGAFDVTPRELLTIHDNITNILAEKDERAEDLRRDVKEITRILP